MADRKIELGVLLSSKKVSKRADTDPNFRDFAWDSITRYLSKDWGSSCKENSEANYRALESDGMILGIYINPDTQERLWITTEPGSEFGHVSYILFENEYDNRHELLENVHMTEDYKIALAKGTVSYE